MSTPTTTSTITVVVEHDDKGHEQNAQLVAELLERLGYTTCEDYSPGDPNDEEERDDGYAGPFVRSVTTTAADGQTHTTTPKDTA